MPKLAGRRRRKSSGLLAVLRERGRGERIMDRERAGKLAVEVAELARKITDLMAQANARRPVSLPPPAGSGRRRSWWSWRRAG
jgi:hypothetical protein